MVPAPGGPSLGDVPTTPVLEHRFVEAVPGLAAEWQPTAVPTPSLVALNGALADELGIDREWLASDEGVAVLAGNAVPDGARPVAMAYAGHQFGAWNPQMGDGRALLLGEVVDRSGVRRDLHLKGSGATPFARRGDGKATLGPMLRELLLGEAMHALGVPTTRMLAVVTTGEVVARQGPEHGAVLTRVAASHLRVGTVQYASQLADPEVLPALVEHVLHRHHPAAVGSDRPALALLDAVAGVQAELVARWMALGFIHGVLNTDNVTLSGEGIDYGPCAFMDRHDPATVFSSIDHGGRYAYGNQPGITLWNLTRLAEALLGLIDEDRETAVGLATEVLDGFADRYERAWTAAMLAKVGLPDEPGADPANDALVAGLPDAMTAARADHTGTFRALADHLRGDDRALGRVAGAGPDALHAWVERWEQALGDADRTATADAMDARNPVYIPRNHLVQEALQSAERGDLSPFGTLLDLLRSPFTERDGFEAHAEPAPEGFDEGFRTFCGT